MMMTEKDGVFYVCDNTPHWEQFEDIVKIETRGERLNFTAARLIADAEAARLSRDPMLLAWYEAETGKFSPGVECACARDKPAWLVYAKSRGGEIQIVINDLEYVFIYRPGG